MSYKIEIADSHCWCLWTDGNGHWTNDDSATQHAIVCTEAPSLWSVSITAFWKKLKIEYVKKKISFTNLEIRFCIN